MRTYSVTLEDGRVFSYPEPSGMRERAQWKSWLMRQAEREYIANPAGPRLQFAGAAFTRSKAVA
jgi:hypothetical protein